MAKDKHPSFWAHAEKATACVKAWPSWKREAASAALVSQPDPTDMKIINFDSLDKLAQQDVVDLLRELLVKARAGEIKWISAQWCSEEQGKNFYGYVTKGDFDDRLVTYYMEQHAAMLRENERQFIVDEPDEVPPEGSIEDDPPE